MATFQIRDANGNIIYIEADGAGTSGDPYVPRRILPNLEYSDDGAFTAGTDKVLVPGGFYQATADEVDDGDAGALRMTSRRAGLVAGDAIELASGTVQKRNTSLELVANVGADVATYGVKTLVVTLYNDNTPHDQALTFKLRTLIDTSLLDISATLTTANFAVAGFAADATGLPSGSNVDIVSVPLLGDWPGGNILKLFVSAGTSPSTGTVQYEIWGRS